MTDNNLKEKIYNLELSLLNPTTRASADKLKLLLTENFKEFGSSGKIYYKGDILEQLPKDAEIDNVQFSVSDFQIQLLADYVVLATYTLDKIYPDKKSILSLRSSLWKEDERNGWQMAFHQGTLI